MSISAAMPLPRRRGLDPPLRLPGSRSADDREGYGADAQRHVQEDAEFRQGSIHDLVAPVMNDIPYGVAGQHQPDAGCEEQCGDGDASDQGRCLGGERRTRYSKQNAGDSQSKGDDTSGHLPGQTDHLAGDHYRAEDGQPSVNFISASSIDGWESGRCTAEELISAALAIPYTVRNQGCGCTTCGTARRGQPGALRPD
jgi:hypothetical protein